MTRQTDNIFFLSGDPGQVSHEVVPILKQAAASHPLKRARLCLHQNSEEPVHEMLIVLAQGGYIRPHRHLHKSESFHLLEGEVSALFFSESGHPEKEIRLGRRQNQPFIYRLNRPIFHSQLIWSDYVVFYEVTRGPFLREETEYAPWAPAEGSQGVEAYLNSLRTVYGRPST